VELSLSDDQELFHKTCVRFIETELPMDEVRRLHAHPTGFERSWWQKAAELGWFSLLVAEADGGGSVSGAGLVDATLVAEELGRHIQPGPFVPTNVVASAISALGTPEQKEHALPGVVSGETIVTWAWAASEGDWDRGAGLVAERVGDSYRLTGTRGFVQDAIGADLVLAVAQIEGRSAQFLVPLDADGLSQRPLTCLDLSRRMSELSFSGVVVPAGALLGEGADDASLERQLQTALALNCAETVGVMDAVFAMTVEYSKDRIAFGRPIGSFQSLKHILADEGLYLETCKAGAVAAARAVQGSDPDAGAIASMVAAYVGDMSDDMAQMALQIHGGIGYTWEHDLHLMMRRIRSNAALFGEPTWHRERVCVLSGLGGEEPS
jgi:alkylation response protein AidB-like acyl-CoA dehydrogenase